MPTVVTILHTFRLVESYKTRTGVMRIVSYKSFRVRQTLVLHKIIFRKNEAALLRENVKGHLQLQSSV